jgi:hypothetical protein
MQMLFVMWVYWRIPRDEGQYNTYNSIIKVLCHIVWSADTITPFMSQHYYSFHITTVSLLDRLLLLSWFTSVVILLLKNLLPLVSPWLLGILLGKLLSRVILPS